MTSSGFFQKDLPVLVNAAGVPQGFKLDDGYEFLWEELDIAGNGELSGAHFGIVDGEDCTAGFAAWTDYHRTTPLGKRKRVVLGAGTFYTDKLVFPSYYSAGRYYGSFELVGQGADNTRITANVSAEPFFAYPEPGFISRFRIAGISFLGRNALNPGQIGLAMIAQPQPGESTAPGGLWYGTWEDVYVRYFDGFQVYWKGSGYDNNKMPNMFQRFTQFRAMREEGNHNPVFFATGQIGQWVIDETCQTDGMDETNAPGVTTNAGPNFYTGIDPRHYERTVSSVDTGTDVLTTSSHVAYTGLPLRFIGDLAGVVSVPQVSKGVTYYAAPTDHKNNQNRMRLASSKANAAAGVHIDFSAGGTPANYSLVPIWVASLASNIFTTDAPHRLSTTDVLVPKGTNLPTGLVAGTSYFVVVRSPTTFSLASTITNAALGAVLTVSGGTVNDYGFTTGDAAHLPTTYSMYCGVTSENAEVGYMFVGAWNVLLHGYVEHTKRAIEAWRGSRILVENSRFWDAASNGGNGLLLMAEATETWVAWDEVSNFIQDRTLIDGYFYALNGPASINPRGGDLILQTPSYAASITPIWRNGRRLQVAALTGDTTLNNGSNPVFGEPWEIRFVQDATGGRNVWLSSSYKGIANQILFLGDRTSGSAVVVNVPSTALLRAGMGVSGTGVPIGTVIQSVDSSTQITLSAAVTATATGATFVGTYGLGQVVTTGSTTLGSAVLTCAKTAGIAPGMAIKSANFPADVTVLTVDSATQVTVSANASVTGAANVNAVGGPGQRCTVWGTYDSANYNCRGTGWYSV